MAQLTKEQIQGIVSDMADAGFEQWEIEDTLRGQGVPSNLPTTERSPAQQAMQALPVAGAVLGGMAGPALARQLPSAVGRFIPRAVASGAGQAVGSFLGGASPKEAAVTGLMGGGTEGLFNLGSRLVGATTSVPTETVSRTLAKPTVEAAKTMFGKPAEMGERTIGVGLLRRLAEMRANLSPGRLTKVAVRDAAERAGVRVPLTDLHSTIDAGIADAESAVGGANTMASSRLSMLKSKLAKKFPSGDMTPSQADAQLRAFQRDADMASARNNPFLATTYNSLKRSLRGSFFKSVDQTVPGSDIAKATGEASKYLNAIENLDQFVSNKTPETFVRSLFSREQPAQSALQALRDFEQQAGTGGSLEREIHDLSMKRDWTTTESGRAFSVWRALEKIVAKPLTKTGILLARPAGQAAAATAAFTQAFDPMAHP